MRNFPWRPSHGRLDCRLDDFLSKKSPALESFLRCAVAEDGVLYSLNPFSVSCISILIVTET